MRRGTIVLLFFILVAIAIVAVSQFLSAQPPIEITVAVHPLAQSWVRAEAEAFNNSDAFAGGTRRVRVSVTTIDDMEIWGDTSRTVWTPESHPDAWIPASSTSVSYTDQGRIPVEIAIPSLAQTPLMWGGYASRVDAITGSDAQPFDWDAVAAAADIESWANIPGGQRAWGFFKLAFDQPGQAFSGYTVLLSGAADYGSSAAVDNRVITDAGFRTWFQPIANSVPNFNTLGADPAAALASRGASVADIALLPESRWLNNLEGLLKNEPVRLAYPEYNVVLDFPFVRWRDTLAERQQAVTLFGDWLSSRSAETVRYGLRPPTGAVEFASAPLFAAAEPYGVQAAPTLNSVTPPARSDAQRFIQWFNTVR